jgi:hypothetical protein
MVCNKTASKERSRLTLQPQYCEAEHATSNSHTNTHGGHLEQTRPEFFFLLLLDDVECDAAFPNVPLAAFILGNMANVRRKGRQKKRTKL